MTNEQAEEWAATVAHEESEAREEAARPPTPWAPHMVCACPNPDAAECVRSRCRERVFDDGLGEIECDHCGCECECACHDDDRRDRDDDASEW